MRKRSTRLVGRRQPRIQDANLGWPFFEARSCKTVNQATAQLFKGLRWPFVGLFRHNDAQKTAAARTECPEGWHPPWLLRQLRIRFRIGLSASHARTTAQVPTLKQARGAQARGGLVCSRNGSYSELDTTRFTAVPGLGRRHNA